MRQNGFRRIIGPGSRATACNLGRTVLLARSAANESASPWLPAEDREKMRDQKMEAVQDMALALFIEQGYHHVKMSEVAERLNVTKPALYNYFRSKEDILYSCWVSGHERLQQRIREEIGATGSGLERLRRLIRIYAETMTTTYGKSLVRLDDRDMDETNRRAILQRKREIDGVFRDLIAAGIADGSIRATDVRMAAFAIAGALNWIGHWHRTDGPLSPEEIGKDFALRLTAGLESRG